jgi:putative tryptophan/tyrosine transport system substrate-binding protein
MMRRREFIAGLGSAAARPVVARAQQGDRVRRIGVLMTFDENDPVAKTRISAFTQALADLGWTDGRNLRMDFRWGGADTNRIRALAHELVSLQPDIMIANATPATAALQRETRTIPIVFATVADPVASGLVARLDRPGGNITGFAGGERPLAGKWLELLSEIAPGLKRAATMFDPDNPGALVFLPPFETAAGSLKVEPIIAPVHSDVEIEMAINALGREPGGGLVIMGDIFFDRASRTDHIDGRPKQCTSGVQSICVCQRRRFALLRTRPGRQLASRCLVCGSHSARREAGRSPSAVADKI